MRGQSAARERGSWRKRENGESKRNLHLHAQNCCLFPCAAQTQPQPANLIETFDSLIPKMYNCIDVSAIIHAHKHTRTHKHGALVTFVKAKQEEAAEVCRN